MVRGHYVDLTLGDHLLVAGDVTDAVLGQDVVAAFHLLDGPVQCTGRLTRVHHNRSQQVGQVVVLTEFDALGVNENEADFVGRRAHNERRDERVDAGTLSGAGSSRDEYVGHLGQVDNDRLSRDVSAQGHVEGVGGRYGFIRGEEIAERDESALTVRDFDADSRATGNRRQDAHVRRGHGICDVTVK